MELSLHCMARNALGKEFGSAAQLSKRPGSVWNCLWGNALKRSPGIIRKSRVSYPVPGFLSSATWPSLPKKHYNGLNQNQTFSTSVTLYHSHILDQNNTINHDLRLLSELTLLFLMKHVQLLSYRWHPGNSWCMWNK